MRAARKNTLLHAHLILLLGLARASISRLCLCEWDMDSKQNMGINWIRAPKNDPKLVTLLSFFGMDQTRCGRPRKSWTISAIWTYFGPKLFPPAMYSNCMSSQHWALASLKSTWADQLTINTEMSSRMFAGVSERQHVCFICRAITFCHFASSRLLGMFAQSNKALWNTPLTLLALGRP